MTQLESYNFRLSSRAFSNDMKSDLKTLGELGYTNFDKNVKVMMDNRGKSVDQLIALL